MLGTLALAGISPSPFRQISAIALDVKIHGKQLAKICDTLVCDSSVKSAVVELHDNAYRLELIVRACILASAPAVSTYNSDYAGVEGEWLLDTLEDLKFQVKSIIRISDKFLANAPDCLPDEIIGALLNVNNQAVVLKKTVNKIIRKFKEMYGCTEDADCGCNGELIPCSDFTTESDCAGQFGCDWNAAPGVPAYCAPTDVIITQCSDISYEQCNNRSSCYTMTCVDGICQQ
jgi:hypothetical protein